MQAPNQISDRRAVDGGIIFSVVVSLAIILLSTWLLRFEIATQPEGDTGFFYEWRLANPNFWSRATAWLGFAIHNLLIWGTIWWAQERTDRKYTATLKGVNVVALVINGVFILLHYVQTAVFYDGIAQDIPSWTAQFAVIIMLFIIMMMENRRRGMFFGKKLSFRKEMYTWLARYHGYAFSFAVIYTFWFHPMVPTPGHILGFLHVMLVMLQGSVMFTRMHVNRYWIFLNEILVLPHAALIAFNQGGDIVYMFLFGFMSIFIVTQMHGLGLKEWVKYVFYAGFAISLLITYTLIREPFHINEVIRIPLIDYGMIFITYGLWLLFARLSGTIDSFRATEPPPPVPAVGD
jgi:hypothetical protein